MFLLTKLPEIQALVQPAGQAEGSHPRPQRSGACPLPGINIFVLRH